MARSRLLVSLLLLALAAVVLTPVEVSYATSDSMAPTIEDGDGYLLVPADDVETGDVITYYSTQKDAYVTHRVVGTGQEGYLTKGDGNPTSDQAAGYPPVASDRVVGKVVTVDGSPLTVPFVGPVATALDQHRLAILLALGATSAILLYRQTRRDRRRGSVVRVRGVLLAVLLACVVVSSVFVLTSAQHLAMTGDASPGPADGATVNSDGTVSQEVQLVRSPWTHSLMRSQPGRLLDEQVLESSSRPLFGVPDGLQAERIMVTVDSVPRTANAASPTVSVYTYPRTLPRGVLTSLHAVHPVVATLASVLVVFGPLTAAVWVLLDPQRPLRSRNSARFSS